MQATGWEGGCGPHPDSSQAAAGTTRAGPSGTNPPLSTPGAVRQAQLGSQGEGLLDLWWRRRPGPLGRTRALICCFSKSSSSPTGRMSGWGKGVPRLKTQTPETELGSEAGKLRASRRHGCKSWLPDLLAVKPWACHPTLSLSFPVCRVRMLKGPTSRAGTGTLDDVGELLA